MKEYTSCPDCEALYHRSFSACPACQDGTIRDDYCPHCGERYDGDWVPCPHCGKERPKAKSRIRKVLDLVRKYL